MDQPIVVEKDKKVEEGCDTRNYYTGWNVSTEQNLRQRKNEFLMQYIIYFVNINKTHRFCKGQKKANSTVNSKRKNSSKV